MSRNTDDKANDGTPHFIDPPTLQVRMSMAEVFVLRAGKIAERRAWVIELKENNYR